MATSYSHLEQGRLRKDSVRSNPTMDDPRSIGEGLFSDSGFTARLVVAIIVLALFLQLVVLTVTILRGMIYALITTINVFVVLPVWALFNILRIPLKLFKFVILVLVWSVCSVARGFAALFILFGLLRGSRHGRAKAGGDGKILETSRQEAGLTSAQDSVVAGRRHQGWQVHILFPDMPERGRHNIGFVVGGMDTTGAWQPSRGWIDGSGGSGSALDHRSWRRYSEASRP